MVTTPDQMAATLLGRHRRALEESRARAVAVRSAVERVISERGRAGEVRRAWLIGSLAHGTFGAGSDVDVVVEGLDPQQVGALYGALVDASRTEVDLLRLEELPPAFAARVLAEGVLLHGA